VSELIVILVPVLRRPHRIRPLLDSIDRATPEPHRVCFIPSPDDLPEKEAIREAGGEILLEDGGGYARKINRAASATEEPLLFLAADDLHFHPGWLAEAKRLLTEGIGVVATNDLCNPRTMRGELATHPLVTRDYVELGTIDEPGKLMHESYPHEYADAELTETAKHRKAFAYAPNAIVEHLHPDAGKAPTDALYAARPERMRTGQRIFRTRRALWT